MVLFFYFIIFLVHWFFCFLLNKTYYTMNITQIKYTIYIYTHIHTQEWTRFTINIQPRWHQITICFHKMNNKHNSNVMIDSYKKRKKRGLKWMIRNKYRYNSYTYKKKDNLTIVTFLWIIVESIHWFITCNINDSTKQINTRVRWNVSFKIDVSSDL